MKHSLKDNLSNEFLEIFIKQNLRGFEKKSYFTLVGISKNETLFSGGGFSKNQMVIIRGILDLLRLIILP